MKKIYYSFTLGLALIGFVLIGLLSGCEDVNEQFDQHVLDSLTTIKNVANYEYTLADADYKAFGTAIQKPITDQITPIESAAKAKKDSINNKLYANISDSIKIENRITTLNAQIATLKLDPTYVFGGSITTDKYLPIDVLTAPEYVAALLESKYKLGDEEAVVMVTYNAEFDTTAITQKATMTTANYDAMGTGTDQPGKNDYFSASINPTYYIPVFLKQSFPYAKVGDKWLIRYKFYTGTTTVTRWLVSVYDGTIWSNTGKTTPTQAKFAIKNGAWKYIDTDILVGLNTGISSNLGDFTAISVVGDQVWAWNTYKYMMITGFVTPNYNDNEDWLVSPAMDLTKRGDSTFLTFSHTGKFFGTDFIAGAKKQATVWISTTSDGTTINAADWTQITFDDSDYNFLPGWVWVTVKPVKLTAYAGMSNVRIAFKYLSLKAEGYAGTYELKKVYVYEK